MQKTSKQIPAGQDQASAASIPTPTPSDTASKDRPKIAKELARRSKLSRRSAERAVIDGSVKVMGKRVTNPAERVDFNCELSLAGAPLNQRSADALELYLYHKPRGLVVSHRDRHNATIFSELPNQYRYLKPVGRLDLQSEGLLLLVNDGELARRLESPGNFKRRYRVRVRSTLEKLKRLQAEVAKGIEVEGIRYRPIQVNLEESAKGGANRWLSVVLDEGKNREIRRIMEHYQITVSRLVRTGFGPMELGNLERGKIIHCPRDFWFKRFGLADDG